MLVRILLLGEILVMMPKIGKKYLFYDSSGNFMFAGEFMGSFVQLSCGCQSFDLSLGHVHSWIPLPPAPSLISVEYENNIN